MATEKKGMLVNGTCNGINSYKKKDNTWVHEVIVVVPGWKNVTLIELHPDTPPNQYVEGEAVKMMIEPKFYNGRISGLMQAL